MKTVKPRKCKACGEVFTPPINSSLATSCSYGCALKVADEKVRQKAAKAIHRERKERIKTKSQLETEAQAAFNRFIRARDEGLDCIGCDRPGNDNSAGWHCGHFKSIGSHPELRFNEFNANRQCGSCNKGSARYSKTESTVSKQYRKNLIKKIGLEQVEKLETYGGMPNWTHDDLRKLKAEYRKKWKHLER